MIPHVMVNCHRIRRSAQLVCLLCFVSSYQITKLVVCTQKPDKLTKSPNGGSVDCTQTCWETGKFFNGLSEAQSPAVDVRGKKIQPSVVMWLVDVVTDLVYVFSTRRSGSVSAGVQDVGG